jgi:hypothetical protein
VTAGIAPGSPWATPHPRTARRTGAASRARPPRLGQHRSNGHAAREQGHGEGLCQSPKHRNLPGSVREGLTSLLHTGAYGPVRGDTGQGPYACSSWCQSKLYATTQAQQRTGCYTTYRRAVDGDAWYGLCDTEAGPAAGISTPSTKQAFIWTLIGSRALAAYGDVDGSSTANNRPWSRKGTARLLRRPDASASAHGCGGTRSAQLEGVGNVG